jgi:DNA-binding GntR family transcriptional regulator
MIERLDSKPALIDRVLERLVAAIADGTLAPGERLTQETVAAKLGVSRQPVSHALQVLRRRGLVVQAGKRGLEVAALDAGRLRDLYAVRAALDGLAGWLAAERARHGLVTAAVRQQASRLVATGTRLAARGSIGELIRADVAFHSLIHRMSGNLAIVEMVAEQWPHFMRSMGVALADPAIRARIWAEHAGIWAAIGAGEPAAAESAAQRHTRGAGEDTARKLEDVASVA